MRETHFADQVYLQAIRPKLCLDKWRLISVNISLQVTRSQRNRLWLTGGLRVAAYANQSSISSIFRRIEEDFRLLSSRTAHTVKGCPRAHHIRQVSLSTLSKGTSETVEPREDDDDDDDAFFHSLTYALTHLLAFLLARSLTHCASVIVDVPVPKEITMDQQRRFKVR